MVPLIFLSLGLVLLVIGAEGLIRGASGIALKFGLSPLVTGLTVVAFGTSAPELAVSIRSGLQGSGEMVIGNVVGSNLFNVAVIMAITALVTPLKVQLQVIRLDMPVMLVATAAFILFARTGFCLSRIEGTVLFLTIVGYTFLLVRLAQRENQLAVVEEMEIPVVGSKPGENLWQPALLALAGFGLLILGANLMVDNAIILATRLGVSEAVIGLTIVAAGTSLPELATSLIAAVRRQTDLAVGNLVGSNIFNLLAIAGLASLVTPSELGDIGWLDLGFLILTSFLLLPFLWTGFRMVRLEGAVMLLAYLSYLFLRWPRG